MAADIVIKGAREHNLRDVSLTLPRNKLICLTGVSGSGKSSLAFDTLYAEGQRRYVESLSSFARQFLGQMPKPDVDLISGLSPSISISQKTSGQNPRSTVGTITEIYDYLRVLFARTGQGHCPQCGKPITAQTREQIIDRIGVLEEGVKFSILAPIIRAQKGEHRDLFEDLLKQGFVRGRVDGETVSLSSPPSLDRQMRHNIEVVVDRLTAGPGLRTRLAEAVDLALKIGKGNLIVALEPPEATDAKDVKGKARVAPPPEEFDDENEDEDEDNDNDGDGEAAVEKTGRKAKGAARGARNPNDIHLSAHYACTPCGLSFEPPTPQLFSFNSPQGMCPECDGLGEVFGFDLDLMIPNKGRSFKQGAIETIGPWADLGRWRRHIFQGVADTLEHKLGLDEGIILETAWEELAPEIQQQLLFGTGDLHITYTWRQGPSGHKYGGKYEGIIPELTSKYKQSESGMQRRQLEKYMRTQGCTSCHGARLNPQARAVRMTTKHDRFRDRPGLGLPDICSLSVSDCVDFFSELDLDTVRQTIAAEVLKEIRGRLGFLTNVGLEYLTLDRTAPTLSGGESQRIRLAGQIGCGLVGVLYILDEPSIGLHPRDNDRLLGTLERLRDLGNTVVVVEHDEDTMRASDYLIDFGPGPGVRGGEVVVAGNYEAVCKEKRSLTGQFLSGERKIEVPTSRRAPKEHKLTIIGAAANNLKNIDVEIPLGLFVCVTGASGSGKSSLVNDILVEALNRDLNGGLGNPGTFERMDGLKQLDKLISIDQSPIGRTPRSNPSTYIKVFDDIRKLYAQLPESKARGYQEGRFSFNVDGGRCEACEGNGSTRLEMDFLADVWVKCPVCDGHRFNRETLQVRFKGKSISEVLEMDIQQALEHFANIPNVAHKLQTLHDVGLDYLKLGQPSPTLSGGEAQRVKLARELVKKSTGRTLYLLDEPTTGLHFADISLLLKVLHDFANAGNTVLVVEHNLDVIKTADWVIDLGPDGGAGGGRIIAQGTPEQVAAVEESHTGQALKRFLYGEGHKQALAKAKGPQRPRVAEATSIKVRGARQHNLKSVDVEIPRDMITVCCGPSGSGKSSLAMDTIYAEGQRRYVESLSSYARQFVGQMQKPQLEHIEGLSPAIAIEQKHLGHTPRSTVGTVTEIYDYLRILFARLGKPYCPACDIPIGTQTVDQIVDKLMLEPEGTKLYLMAPQDVQVGEKYETLFEDMRARGYQRVRIDGKTYPVEEPPTIDRRRKHLVEVVVDRSVIRSGARSRIADSIESALDLGRGVIHAAYVDDNMPEEKWRVEVHSRHMSCNKCGRSFEPLSPHNFSFNSALGWCGSCEGLGIQTGANPAALLNDPKFTLAQGAIALWPDAKHPLFKPMLQALGVHLGVPTDVPFEQLGAKARRAIFHGRGEDWVEVAASAAGPAFRFQYKGLYPALEEAARLSPALRGKLDHLVDEVECSICGGARLRDDAAAMRFRERTIDEICRTPLGPLLEWVENQKLTGSDRKIAGELWREVSNRLRFLVDVGLEYLTIGRSAPTLSGGESQRIRLASQVGSGLTGVLYVLDEPTIGLHPRDNLRLLNALFKLRDLGNTLLMVEHDKDVIAGADQLLDFGPRAGVHGGEVVARGTPEEVGKQKNSVTGPYLSGIKGIAIPSNRRVRVEGGEAKAEGKTAPVKSAASKATATKTKKKPVDKKEAVVDSESRTTFPGPILEIRGASHNNLHHVNVQIPLGTFTVVTGVSGSGKSSLVEDVLYNSLARTLHRARTFPGKHDALRGVEQINKVIRVDQMPLGQTPTSNPATYTGVFDQVRTLFANLPESKLRGYTPRRFSFNVPGGRCEKCEGNGQLRIEMHFLPDVWVECDECRGKRYNPETLAVQFRGCSIADVLDMPVGKALEVFQNIPQIRKILQTLCDVGLDYVTLGQPAPTLSGGEAQRVKLAAELARPDTGRTLYLLDEPTTGLHFDDLAKLLEVLHRLVDLGNSIVVIEHNLDVIKTADWLIDMGPEAGEGGGYVVAAGTPEQLVTHALAYQAQTKKPAGRAKPAQELLRSYTGEMLEPILAAGPYAERKPFDPTAVEKPREDDVDLDAVGEEAQMPWEVDGRRWHITDRVARNGKPCRWDGRILAAVVDKIQELGEFAPTNFNSRTIVEITGEKKSDGWFFHASTGEEWLLKLKFRTAKSTFKRDEVVERLNLKPLNEMPDLPVYGTEPRVKCKNLRGPWQEVQLQVHAWDEINTPAFWKFVEESVRGFQKFADKAAINPENIMPWKVLGQKWHFARKGFPPGKKVSWDSEVLEELCELLSDTAEGQFLWNNQQLIHYCLKGRSEPWATVLTKKPHAVELHLNGPKNKFALGRVASFGLTPAMDKDRADRDVVRLQFDAVDQITDEALSDFLNEHAEAAVEK